MSEAQLHFGDIDDFTFGSAYLRDHAGSLISEPNIAIVELIANAYDAGATKVIVKWPEHRNEQFEMMNIQQAIDAPRIHHQWLPDELVGEPFGLSGDTQRALTARGHTLAKLRYLGDAEGIMIEEKTGMRLGATDPRRSDGQAVGYREA